jgi:hypothetical protein
MEKAIKGGAEVTKTQEAIEVKSEKGSSLTDKIRENPWIVSTLVLGILVAIFLISDFSGSTTGAYGAVADKDVVQAKVMEFVNAQVTEPVEVVSTNVKNGLYEIVVKYQGNDIPLYATLDGVNLVQGVTPIDTLLAAAATQNDTGATDTTATNVPKSDKPVVEAFVFSYCPYGLQFEKALFPVYDLLKNKADINIVFIGAMHGEHEKTESLRQISILKLYNKDKLFSYLKEFDTNTDLGSCGSDATCIDKYLPAIYTKLGIDKAKVDSYMKTNAEALYNADVARASQLGISGSPTFVINGVKVQVSRTPDAIGKAVCAAFNTAPSECSTALSTQAASAGFGASTGTAATTTGAQC